MAIAKLEQPRRLGVADALSNFLLHRGAGAMLGAMDASLSIRFDAQPVLALVQGEDRSIAVTFSDANTGLPLNLSAAAVEFHFPQEGGGVIKRSNGAMGLNAAAVSVSAPPGFFSAPDHGLVSGDPVQVSGSALPAPLVAGTSYLVAVLDANTFALNDSTNTPVVLTSTGVGSFTLTNPTDVVVVAGALGQVALTLRAAVTSLINADLSQSFQAGYLLAGLQRWAVLTAELDVYAQTDP